MIIFSVVMVTEVCMVGQEIATTLLTACTACAYDSYQAVDNPVPGQDLCVMCAAGTGTDAMGSDSETDCMRE